MRVEDTAYPIRLRCISGQIFYNGLGKYHIQCIKKDFMVIFLVSVSRHASQICLVKASEKNMAKPPADGRSF